MAEFVKYIVDISDVTDALTKMDQIPRYVLHEVAIEVEEAAKDILTEVFAEAIDIQDPEAFDPIFADHILSTVRSAKIRSGTFGSEFFVDFDFNSLGTRRELERAFHQGARLADGSILDGPYEGQELAQPDAGKRHAFWLAMHQGETRVDNPDGKGRIRIPEGAWEETKRKYVEIWGDKCPEWMYLEFGQEEWEPYIESYPVIEEFTTRFNEVAEQIFSDRVTEAIERAEEEELTFTEYGVRGPGGRFVSFRR